MPLPLSHAFSLDPFFNTIYLALAPFLSLRKSRHVVSGGQYMPGIRSSCYVETPEDEVGAFEELSL